MDAKFLRNVERLAQAQNALEVSALAGVFRSEYTPALDLDLVGIALEHFVSKSGYEGDTVYFLEETTKRWYTYTQARPVFYEKEQSLYNYGGQRYTQETLGVSDLDHHRFTCLVIELHAKFLFRI